MSCSSVKLWKGTVVAGYGTGQIRLYEAVTGILHAEVNAHARWIYSLDIAPFSGLVSCINQIVQKDILLMCWHFLKLMWHTQLTIHIYGHWILFK